MRIITERWVLKKIAKLRNLESRKERRKREKEELKTDRENASLVLRRVRGVERDVLMDYIIYELNPITWWRIKFFKILKHFDFYKGGKSIIAINDRIDFLVKEDYLYSPDYCEDEDFDRLKLTKKGRQYISWFWWIRVVYNNRHIQQLISMLITWGGPLVILWIASQVFPNFSFTL